MRDKSHWILTLTAAAMLGCGAGETSTQDSDDAKAPREVAHVASPKTAAASPAVRADARVHMREVLARQGLGLVPTQRRDGLREIRLRNRLHHAQAITRDADGTLHTTCVDRPEALEQTILTEGQAR